MNQTSRPVVETIEEKPYLAIQSVVAPDNFRAVIDQNFPRIPAWLAERGQAMSAPPFIRYLSVDHEGNPSKIEMGATVGEMIEPEVGFTSGILPAGRYLTYTHTGPFQHEELDDLRDATEMMLAWARENGIELDRTETPEGTEFGASLEFYLVDPGQEPDFTKWQTRIEMLTVPA